METGRQDRSMPIPTYSELLGRAGKSASRGGEGGSVLVWVNSAEMLGYCSRSSQEGLQIAFGERDLRAATALDNHLPSAWCGDGCTTKRSTFHQATHERNHQARYGLGLCPNPLLRLVCLRLAEVPQRCPPSPAEEVATSGTALACLVS